MSSYHIDEQQIDADLRDQICRKCKPSIHFESRAKFKAHRYHAHIEPTLSKKVSLGPVIVSPKSTQIKPAKKITTTKSGPIPEDLKCPECDFEATSVKGRDRHLEVIHNRPKQTQVEITTLLKEEIRESAIIERLTILIHKWRERVAKESNFVIKATVIAMINELDEELKNAKT